MILRTLVAACCVTLAGSAVAHAEDSTTTSVPVSVEDTTTTTTLVERPIPERSGTGRRAVYSIRQQHVWVVDGGETVIRTFPVSGMKGQPKPGTYSVFSQSLSSFSPELPGVTFRYMTRFAIGRNGGNIGFHEIPVRNGKPMQTV